MVAAGREAERGSGRRKQIELFIGVSSETWRKLYIVRPLSPIQLSPRGARCGETATFTATLPTHRTIGQSLPEQRSASVARHGQRRQEKAARGRLSCREGVPIIS